MFNFSLLGSKYALERTKSLCDENKSLESISLQPKKEIDNSNKIVPEEYEIISKYSIKITRIYELLTDSFLKIIDANIIVGDLVGGQITADYAKVHQRDLLIEATLSLNASKTGIEEINGALGRYKTTEDVRKIHNAIGFFNSMTPQIEEMRSKSKDFLLRVINNEKVKENDIYSLVFRQSILMIDLENAYLSVLIQTVKKNHPQYYLNHCYMETNEATLYLYRTFLQIFEAENINVDKINSLISLSNYNILRTREHIQTGKKVATETILKSSDYNDLNQYSKEGIEKFFRALNTYHDSFETETQIIDAYDELLDTLYSAANSNPDDITQYDLETYWDMLGTKVIILVEKRMQLQRQRIELIGEFFSSAK